MKRQDEVIDSAIDMGLADESETRGGGGERRAGLQGVMGIWSRIPDSLRGTVPVIVAIIALGTYTASQTPLFLTQTNLRNILQQSSVLGLIAVGMTALMIAGLMDLSVGTMASFISVVGALMAKHGSSAFVIVVAAVLIGLGASSVWGLIVGYVKVHPFILTLGGMSIFLSLGLALSKGQPVPVEGMFVSLDIGKWLGVPVSSVLFLVAAVVMALFLKFTRVGRNTFAMGSNPQAAFLAGVPQIRLPVYLFAISGVLVGLAAIVMIGRLGAGDPTAGSSLGLQAIAAVVIGGSSLYGGTGTVFGTMLGVLLLGLIQNSLNILGIQIFYQDLVYGSVLIVAIVSTSLREQGRLRLPRLRHRAK